jgi:hypothetical protein
MMPLPFVCSPRDGAFPAILLNLPGSRSTGFQPRTKDDSESKRNRCEPRVGTHM